MLPLFLQHPTNKMKRGYYQFSDEWSCQEIIQYKYVPIASRSIVPATRNESMVFYKSRNISFLATMLKENDSQ